MLPYAYRFAIILPLLFTLAGCGTKKVDEKAKGTQSAAEAVVSNQGAVVDIGMFGIIYSCEFSSFSHRTIFKRSRILMTLYPFWLRTPAAEITLAGPLTTIVFRAADQAAGPRGETLHVGYGAWADRPLRSNEPRSLQILGYSNQSSLDQIVRATLNIHNFTRVLMTPHLTLQFQLGPVVGGHFCAKIDGMQMPWEPLFMRADNASSNTGGAWAQNTSMWVKPL